MTYFARKSYSNSPGGRDGEFEIIYGQEIPWLMENKMICLCKDESLARHISKLLNLNPFKIL